MNKHSSRALFFLPSQHSFSLTCKIPAGLTFTTHLSNFRFKGLVSKTQIQHINCFKTPYLCWPSSEQSPTPGLVAPCCSHHTSPQPRAHLRSTCRLLGCRHRQLAPWCSRDESCSSAGEISCAQFSQLKEQCQAPRRNWH